MLKINKKNNKRGFTLIEIIVSLAVFSAVILIILGAVIAIINLQRRTNAFRVAQENISYAFESMVKEMRTGSSYNNGEASGVSADHIDFVNDQNKKVFYKLEDGQIKKCITDLKTDINCVNPYFSLTSAEVVINELSFVLSGVGTDSKQPKVRIILSGGVGVGTRYFSDFFLQTIVSQRRTDS